jgi:DNA-binding response OmpR family regulator
MKPIIVIIEDERNVALLLARALHIAGYKPVLLYTYKEAWDYLRPLIKSDTSHIAAFVFDYMLDSNSAPVTTSAALMDLVKRHINYEGIILANSIEEEANVVLRRLGCTHTRPTNKKVYAINYLVKLLKDRS